MVAEIAKMCYDNKHWDNPLGAGGCFMAKPKIGSLEDNLINEIKKLRHRGGCLDNIYHAEELADFLGREDESDEHKTICLLALINYSFRDGQADRLLAALNLHAEYKNLKSANKRRKAYEKDYLDSDLSIDTLTYHEDDIIGRLVAKAVRLKESGKLEKILPPKPECDLSDFGVHKKETPDDFVEGLSESGQDKRPFQSSKFPEFVAAPCFLSPITATNSEYKTRAIYQSGYGEHSSVVLWGDAKDGGSFAVISNDYVLSLYSHGSRYDVPRSLVTMVHAVISNLGKGFIKKRIGFTSGHNEIATAEKLSVELKKLLNLEGVHIENCSTDEFDSYDVIIVGCPQKPFRYAEVSALSRYVDDGGGVLFCGSGYFWVHIKGENGETRKVEDFPINMIGELFGFKIESGYAGKFVDLSVGDTATYLYFTPMMLARDILSQSRDEVADKLTHPRVKKIMQRDYHNADAVTQANHALRYEQGSGIPRNQDYALYWYKMSAFSRDSEGQLKLALFYGENNPFLYRFWLMLSAKNGNHLAAGHLGLAHYYGKHDVEVDKDLGFAMIERAAENGHHFVMYDLGMIYIDKEMYEKAIECFMTICFSKKGAMANRPSSHYQLGLLLKDGKGCTKDLYKAQTHLQKAVESQHDEARLALELINDEVRRTSVNYSLYGDIGDLEFTMDALEGTKYYSFFDDEKENLLQWLNGEFELRLNQSIEEYLTEEQLDIFDKIANKDPETIKTESERLRITESFEYRSAKASKTAEDEFTLISGILKVKWLIFYVPNLLALGKKEHIELKHKLVLGEIDVFLDHTRKMYTADDPPPTARWNSIINQSGLPTVSNGDERNFVWVREYDSGEFQTQLTIESGKQYEVMVFYHNNAAPEQNRINPKNAIMFRAMARSFFPKRLNNQQTGIILVELSADNAAGVWAEAKITASEGVELELSAEGAKLYNDSNRMSHPAGSGRALPKLFAEKGTVIGWHDLNGELPGGHEYSGFIRYIFSAHKTERV